MIIINYTPVVSTYCLLYYILVSSIWWQPNLYRVDTLDFSSYAINIL